MWILHDPDEWETFVETENYGTFMGVPLGSVSIGQRRRSPEEVAKIKAEKQRQHEDEILAEAAAILKRRGLPNIEKVTDDSWFKGDTTKLQEWAANK